MQEQTQLQTIRKHFKKKLTITSWEAITRYGITRLSHYIYKLRGEGMRFDGSRKVVKGKIVHTYKLVK